MRVVAEVVLCVRWPRSQKSRVKRENDLRSRDVGRLDIGQSTKTLRWALPKDREVNQEGGR